MSTSVVRVVLLLALASTAAAADASTLRGTHVKSKHHRGDKKTTDAATTEAVNDAVVNKAVPAAAEPGKTSTIKLEHTMTTGENLGQNVPYMGIDYLGTGYDILKGNPDGDQDTKIDPGFRRPVVYLTWEQDNKDLTRDMQFLQPREGWAMPETSCNMATTSSESSSMDEYTSELSVAAEVSGGYDGLVTEASFSASAGYSSFSTDVASKEGSRYSLRSYCVKFKAGLNRGPTKDTGIKPVASFETQAKGLPLIFNCNTKNTNCVYVKSKGGKYLTLKKTGDVWTPAFIEKKKGFIQDPANLFTFSKTNTGSLVHAASGQAIYVKIGADGAPKAVVGSDSVSQEFAYNQNTGSLTCTNCEKDDTGSGSSEGSGSSSAPTAVSLHLTAAAEALKAVAGPDKATSETQRWSVITVDTTEDEIAWTNFFSDYGTHFIDTVHLGGKMVFTMEMDKSSKESMDSSSVDVAAEFEAASGPVSGSASASVSTSSEASSAYASSKKTKKTIVLGGNPPEDPRTGFGEWAESVAAAPMPVKYTLRPLIEAGSAVLADPSVRKSYDLMLTKYLAETAKIAADSIKAKNAAFKETPTLLPGESWDMLTVGKITKNNGYVLKLKPGGAFGIVDRLGAVLWDSLSGFGKIRYDEKLSPKLKYGKLTYKLNGELVMHDSAGKETWSSLTKKANCGGQGPGKVTFKNGVLKILDDTEDVLWTSGTQGKNDKAKQTSPKYFGGGKIKKQECIVECATLATDYKLAGSKKFKPGKYEDLKTTLGARALSFSVTKGQCFLMFYYKAKIAKDPLVTIHATSECGSGPTHWKGWTKGGTSSIIAGCGGGKGGDNGEGKINVAYSYNLSPTCADWAKVAYPEALGVVAAWDLFSVERWAGAKSRVMSSATGYSDYGSRDGCRSAEGESTANQKEAYELMTAALRSYIKPSCNIGYETVGVATC